MLRVVQLPKVSPNHVEDRVLVNVVHVVLHVVECVRDVTTDVVETADQMYAWAHVHQHVLIHVPEIVVQHAVHLVLAIV